MGGGGLEALQLQVAVAASLEDVGAQGPDWELEEALRLSIKENRAKEDEDEQTRLGVEASLREGAQRAQQPRRLQPHERSVASGRISRSGPSRVCPRSTAWCRMDLLYQSTPSREDL
jgi:hypothetical protein